MRKLACIAALLSCAGASCGSPPAPGTPENLPPGATAGTECPDPVVSFAHRRFYFADLATRHSCQVFLEQDECILAIFEDCASGRESRQWEGHIDGDDVVRLEPIYLQPPQRKGPSFCRGMLQSPGTARASATLTCEGSADVHPGLYLEGVDYQAPAFGTHEKGAIPVRPRSDQKRDALPDFMVISPGGRPELWVLISDFDPGAEAGVFIRSLDGSAAVDGIPIERPFALAATPSADAVFVASRRALHRIDTATRQITTSTSSDRELSALAVAPNGDVIIATLVEQTNETMIERRSSVDFSHLSPPKAVLGGIDQIVPLPPPQTGTTSATRSILVSGYSGHEDFTEGLVYTLTATLGEAAETIRDFKLSHALVIPDSRRVAVVSLAMNSYRELDIDTGRFDAAIPLPFFSGGRALAYDPARDRVYVAGAWGRVLAYIDRGKRRAMQPALDLKTNEYATALAVHPTLGTLYVLAGNLGHVDVVTPK